MEGLPLFPPRASSLAGGVDALFFAAVGVSLAFSLLIAACIVWFAVRYRRRHPASFGISVPAPYAVEIVWTAVPLGLTLVLFGWGAQVFFVSRRPPRDAVPYWLVGRQWMWKFQHPEGRREVNELHVPVGVPIRLTMTSEDVIHSFFVPAFRAKADVVPGRYTDVWFLAIRPGTYHLFCAEYCGTEHSRMRGRVVVMERHAYQEWLQGPGAGQPPEQAGAEIFERLACAACHKPDGTGRGPRLQGILGSTVRLGGGATVQADETYVRESLVAPAAKVVAGYDPVMPSYAGQLSEEQVIALLAYLRAAAPPAPAAGGGAP